MDHLKPLPFIFQDLIVAEGKTMETRVQFNGIQPWIRYVPFEGSLFIPRIKPARGANVKLQAVHFA
jgi:hypothetical protein